jgi:hypothetical protein
LTLTTLNLEYNSISWKGFLALISAWKTNWTPTTLGWWNNLNDITV